MTKLNDIYLVAVDQTKMKIIQDIDRYLGNKKTMPTLEEYIEERRQFIEQIWFNVWINKASNVPRKEKKRYLHDCGYEVEEVDRQLLNRLFRNEIRIFQPFNGVKWVDDRFKNNQAKWEKRYTNARDLFLKREEEKRQEEKRNEAQAAISHAAEKISEELEELFYLFVRQQVGKRLVDDFANQCRYQLIEPMMQEETLNKLGPFDVMDYRLLKNFLEELTGNVRQTFYRGRVYFDYEHYYDRYEGLVEYSLFNFVPEVIVSQLENISKDYEENIGEKLSVSIVEEWMADTIMGLVEDFFFDLQEEYLSDLLEVGEIPFNEEIHRDLYKKHVIDRERRRVKELAELERKKEEEAKIIEDVFSREYNLHLVQPTQYVLHIGETNTGKTYHALEKMKEAKSGLYLAPLRLLALEVYDKLNEDGIACSLKTGEEEKVVQGAHHISCTVEMFHEKDFYDVVVIDEAQMIADKDRGFSWFKAITKANAKEVHIIGSRNVKDMMLQLLGDSTIDIIEYEREFPLEVEEKEFQLHHTKKGDALVCFSRKKVLETASRLQSKRYKVSMIYGSMPPETRKKQMQRFINGETTVIVSTDAIGMGLNLPIRRIVFLENEKFDGTKRRRLTSQEVKQIAGRAGRKGIYNIGRVAFTSQIKVMKQLLSQQDEPVHTFTIAPTNEVLNRFQKYRHHLGAFFELWETFQNPKGTKKATLDQEQELYEFVRDTEIEAKLSMMDLYGFLHLPFSTRDQGLSNQWLETIKAIVSETELPEPSIKTATLSELELSYKAIGLHLLFLYRLDRRTEAIYWERIRDEISERANESLKNEIKNYKKTCRHCGKQLSINFPYAICNDCHSIRYQRW
ncbi:ATP-dependent RNA helicase SUPV3L1/SUV3 [Oikeobacillus pervagus]|uniref:ATP-dependent RNA helicase SUPV3L1/SUV3 n=1 Tax=Oikeobacillus pervagus TaxID=1325931 RepID=A0AAJ1T6B0_9BACI|nr:helicase-related protein [Oikeobacillus pervagus]MDQ0216006.1 ATP-dependent RNA helicase SUPV3L1/SUV3 [Oikeobacillus pervagus]